MKSPAEEIHNAVKSIIMHHVGDTSNRETAKVVKKELTQYLYELSNSFNYAYMPEIVCENEGSFLTVNFLDKRGNRLETFGDLIHYMDTGR